MSIQINQVYRNHDMPKDVMQYTLCFTADDVPRKVSCEIDLETLLEHAPNEEHVIFLALCSAYDSVYSTDNYEFRSKLAQFILKIKHKEKALKKLANTGIKPGAQVHYVGGGIPKVWNESDFKVLKPSSNVAQWAKLLPGVNTKVKYPCKCGNRTDLVYDVIIHLNDYHKDWNRERIADWIDEMHDKGLINAEFSPWEG
jgi:hypothetical protein